MNQVQERWHDWRYDSRGWYLLNDPEITFECEEDAVAYCDERNRALIGQAAIEERDRIIDLINERMNVHLGFVNGMADANIEVNPSLFTAIAELRAILRAI